MHGVCALSPRQWNRRMGGEVVLWMVPAREIVFCQLQRRCQDFYLRLDRCILGHHLLLSKVVSNALIVCSWIVVFAEHAKDWWKRVLALLSAQQLQLRLFPLRDSTNGTQCACISAAPLIDAFSNSNVPTVLPLFNWQWWCWWYIVTSFHMIVRPIRYSWVHGLRQEALEGARVFRFHSAPSLFWIDGIGRWERREWRHRRLRINDVVKQPKRCWIGTLDYSD